jgi:acetyltransferase-like isoleucine patch superfamily enzyme
MRHAAVALLLRGIQLLDRWRLRRLARRHPGLSVDPLASSNFAVARYSLAPGARLHIGPGVVTERLRGALHFDVAEEASVEIGAGTWLRTDVKPVYVIAFPGARLRVGPDGFLNGCHLSAKREVTLGRRVYVGFGSRIVDGDQHDLDDGNPERVEPVRVGDHVWIAADVTVTRGVTIGDHSVVGTRSLVTSDLPPRTLAYGVPARARRELGDRSATR